jgi:8-oxo-dGTP diphosphatase
MPEATVAAIVIAVDANGIKVLLTRRSIEPFKGRWCLPGGHIDRYEPARESIVREVREETGLGFDAQFFGYFDEIIPGHNIHAVVIAFEGRASGRLNASAYEVSDAGWFSLDEARSMPLAFTHNEILDSFATRMVKANSDKSRS